MGDLARVQGFSGHFQEVHGQDAGEYLGCHEPSYYQKSSPVLEERCFIGSRIFLKPGFRTAF
jgi:hypothetical protein